MAPQAMWTSIIFDSANGSAIRSALRITMRAAKLPCLWTAITVLSAHSSMAFQVAVTVDAGQPLGDLKPIWRMFGADEPNYATLPNGRKLLGELGALKPQAVFFRAHNLLCSGDGTPALKWGSTGAYSEDTHGNAVYNWTILDAIFDAYITSKVRPYAQIGFMPEALSTHPQPYQHHWKPGDAYRDILTGWAYPPKDYDKWRELVRQWVKHCVERYGKAEVETWYWEVWNEANDKYWKGTLAEFHKLHDYAVDGVRRALPTARVGGPDTAGPGGQWMHDFIGHCLYGTNYATGGIGTPLDFIAFHAKGSPTFTNGHVTMGIEKQLRAIDSGFRIVKSYPELKGIPIVIGESDPDGCAACQGDQLGYRNTTMYSSYTAASFARKWELARRHGVDLDAALTWAFTFEGQPPFAGFRQLASAGIDLPVLNVFRMFSLMGGKQLAVTSDHELSLNDIMDHGVRGQPDISAVASLDVNRLAVLLWHYHDDDVPGPDAEVSLTLAGIPPPSGKAKLTRYAVDAEHSNAFTAWRKMGSPRPLWPQQSAELDKAGRLAALDQPEQLRLRDGRLRLDLSVPRQAVVLLLFDLQK
jgi:xylan 1,4-beta-xylosidase